MTTRKRTSAARRTRTVAAGSWLALLAATTLGDAADTVHAEVRADGLSDGDYRLVVQSYDRSDGPLPGPDARPVGSVQRTVTADELRSGVQVDVLELREVASQASSQAPLVVAWIETGDGDLEYDGRAARPTPGSMYGVVKRAAKRVQISLNRKIAA